MRRGRRQTRLERRLARRSMGAASVVGHRASSAGRPLACFRRSGGRAGRDLRPAPTSRSRGGRGAPRRTAGRGAPGGDALSGCASHGMTSSPGAIPTIPPRCWKSAIRRRSSTAWAGASCSRCRPSRSSAAAMRRHRVAPMPKRSARRCPQPASRSSAGLRPASMPPRIAAVSPAPAAASPSSAPGPTAFTRPAIASSRTTSRRAASWSPNSRSARHRRNRTSRGATDS